MFALGWIRADAAFEGLARSSFSMCRLLSEGGNLQHVSGAVLSPHELMCRPKLADYNDLLWFVFSCPGLGVPCNPLNDMLCFYFDLNLCTEKYITIGTGYFCKLAW